VVPESDHSTRMPERLVQERPVEVREYAPRHAARPDPPDVLDAQPSGGPLAAAVDNVEESFADPAPLIFAPTTHPSDSSSLLPDRDLALNQPGAAARCAPVAPSEAASAPTFLSRAFGKKTDDRTSKAGADAELEIAELLRALDGRWRVLHAIPVGNRGSDIDHIAIGPAGVFTINAKHHPDAKVWVGGDTFKVNGRNQRYVRNSRHEAARAAKLLTARAQFDVDVRAIIAVVGAQHGLMVKEQPADGVVTVVTAPMLVKHLEALPNVLGAPSRDRIYDVARHLATWQPKNVSWTDF
jgi:Nuclease-related domain